MTTSSGGEAFSSEDVFEINDFTVVTSLERFVAGLELLFHNWAVGKSSRESNRFKLSKGSLATCEWESKSEKVLFGDNNALNVAHCWPSSLPRYASEGDFVEALALFSPSEAPHDDYTTSASKVMLLPEVEFCPPNIICTQFGVLEFLLITPFDWSRDAVVNENQLQTILSAVNVALCTTDCELPVFVQYGAADRRLFFGVSQSRSMCTHYEAAHLRKPLLAHSHLSGLLEIFAEKVKCPLAEKPSVRVSVQVDYVLQEGLEVIHNFAAASADPVDDALPSGVFAGSTAHLPFGATGDLLDKFTLIANWPNLREEMLNENDVYSDLDPLTAPFWAASVSFQTGISCLMHTSLKTLVDAAESNVGKTLISQLFSSSDSGADASTVRNALSPLAVPQNISITNPAGAPDPASALDLRAMFRWIDAIFLKSADAFLSTESSTQSSSEESSLCAVIPGGAVKQGADSAATKRRPDEFDSRIPQTCINHLNGCKAAPFESLTTRIAVSLTHVLSMGDSGAAACAQLWTAILRELRSLWESNLFLPGIEEGKVPDLGTCRLHQKLQMLQSCIDARLKRHRLLDATTAHTDKNEEFYDAVDWMSEDGDSGSERTDTPKTESTPSDSSSPQGRLRKISCLSLLKQSDVPAFEPVTQERCPMTEDMLEKYADYLSSLGCPEARSRAHLDSLRSDMQAFKAANPGCVFEDFVRWHSPWDFVLDKDTGEGVLSNRMSGENAWKETWDDAQPIPVVHQARLFNESKEAESILQEFGRLSLSELISLILPVVVKCAAKQLLEESVEVISIVEQKLVAFCEKVALCTHSKDFEEYLDMFRELLILETNAARYNALWSRFANADDSLAESEGCGEVRELAVRLVEQSYRAAEFSPLSGGAANSLACVPVERGMYSAAGATLRRLFLTDVRLGGESTSSRNEKKSRDSRLSKEAKLEGKMPSCSRRQYTFRWLVPRPGEASRAVPQRLYASISDDEFRICASISDDCVLT